MNEFAAFWAVEVALCKRAEATNEIAAALAACGAFTIFVEGAASALRSSELF